MIAFDAFATGKQASGTSLTFSHTCSGSNRIILVYVQTAGATDLVSGITYNGVAMTRISTRTDGNNAFISYLYYLIAPASGANNVVVTFSSDPGAQRAMAVSYTGVKQSGQPDANNTTNASSASTITNTLTVVAANSWVIAFATNGAAFPTASTNINATRGNDTVASTVGDSNADEPAGSFAQAWTGTAGQAWIGLQASIAPAPSSVGFFSLL